MVKALDPTQLTNLLGGDGETLYWRFELVSDRLALMEVQDAFGVAHKDDSDPDIAALMAEYDTVRAELMDRIGKQHKKDLDTFESYSNRLCIITAGQAGALGIPFPTDTDEEIAALKANLNEATNTMSGLLV